MYSITRQCSQNTAASILVQSAHITPVLYALHWIQFLPTINISCFLLLSNPFTDSASPFLHFILHPDTHQASLIGGRFFTARAPKVWCRASLSVTVLLLRP